MRRLPVLHNISACSNGQAPTVVRSGFAGPGAL